jgi:signal transduction histidine kinase
MRLLGAAAIAVAFACSDAALVDAPGVVQIPSLQLRGGGTPAMSADGATLDPRALDALGGFRTISLPDYWSLERRRSGLDGWYRARFEVAEPAGDWGLAVDGAWDALQIFVNGQRLIRTSAIDRPAPVAVFASAELLVPIPRALLHAGVNEVTLRFRARPDEIASLRALAIGPAPLLAAAQRSTAFWTATLPRLLALFALSCGLLVLMLAHWSLTTGSLWFGLGTTLWSVAALLTPLAASASSPLGAAISTAAHAFPPCIALGFLRALDLRRPRVEAFLIGSVVLGAALRFTIPPLWVPLTDNLWWTVNAAIGLYALPLARKSVTSRAVPVPRLVLAATGIVVAAGIVDLSSLFAGRAFLGVSLFVVTSPLIGLAAAAGVVSSLSRALEQARTLNTELEQRVEEKRLELDASYARTALLERDRAIAGERARMMRDMHDGTGGQLVSALAMVEGGEVPRDELAEALREALADLRLVIDSLEPGEPDLLAMIAHARARLEPRLERHGLRFAWEVEDVPAPERFGPEQSLHVMRVFQEAVTNALKHAKATTISVRTGTARDDAGRACAYVEVADDGGGFCTRADTPSALHGRGLRNMHRRAEELGGTLTVQSNEQGTVVRLMIPLAAATSRARA